MLVRKRRLDLHLRVLAVLAPLVLLVVSAGGQEGSQSRACVLAEISHLNNATWEPCKPGDGCDGPYVWRSKVAHDSVGNAAGAAGASTESIDGLRHALCRSLSGRSVLVVGDSTSYSFYNFLMQILCGSETAGKGGRKGKSTRCKPAKKLPKVFYLYHENML